MNKKNDKGLVDDMTDESPDMDMEKDKDTYGEKGGRSGSKIPKEKGDFDEEIMEEDSDMDLDEDL